MFYVHGSTSRHRLFLKLMYIVCPFHSLLNASSVCCLCIAFGYAIGLEWDCKISSFDFSWSLFAIVTAVKLVVSQYVIHL